jgi:hypothetical protein
MARLFVFKINQNQNKQAELLIPESPLLDAYGAVKRSSSSSGRLLLLSALDGNRVTHFQSLACRSALLQLM